MPIYEIQHFTKEDWNFAQFMNNIIPSILIDIASAMTILYLVFRVCEWLIRRREGRKQ
jgi:hypothetical protein